MNSQPTLKMLITFNPLVIDASTPLIDVARMLDTSGFHHWPVVDSQRQLQGLISEVDVVQAIQSLCRVGATEGESHCDWTQRTAGEITRHRLITIDHGESIHVALRKMLGHRIHSLPVMNNGQLIGMITSTDFVREMSFGQWSSSQTPVSEHLVNLADPIDPACTLDMALERMKAEMTEYLAVVQDDCPLGVISRRQIRKAICRIAIHERQPCGDHEQRDNRVVSLLTDSVTVRPAQRMLEAAGLMIEKQLQAVAVVNQAHRLLGIVSEDEILRAILEQV